MLLEGMHLPLTTPFHPDGRLNLRKLEQNVARYSLTPAAGLLLLGPTGEPTLLTDEETRAVLHTAAQAAAPAKVLLAGVSRDSVAATLSLIDTAAALGYDAVLLAPPAFSPAERRLYLQSIADRSPLGIVLTGDLSLDLIADLAPHPQILGLLTTGDVDVPTLLQATAAVRRTVTVTPIFAAVTGRVLAAQPPTDHGTLLSAASLTTGGTALATAPPKPTLKTRTKQVGFQILVGITEHMLPGLLAGAVGTAPPLAAAIPQACHEVFAAWKDGDPALAAEKQHRLLDAARTIEVELGVPALKHATDLNGYFGGIPRAPRLPLLGDQKSTVAHQLQSLRS